MPNSGFALRTRTSPSSDFSIRSALTSAQGGPRISSTASSQRSNMAWNPATCSGQTYGQGNSPLHSDRRKDDVEVACRAFRWRTIPAWHRTTRGSFSDRRGSRAGLWWAMERRLGKWYPGVIAHLSRPDNGRESASLRCAVPQLQPVFTPELHSRQQGWSSCYAAEKEELYLADLEPAVQQLNEAEDGAYTPACAAGQHRRVLDKRRCLERRPEDAGAAHTLCHSQGPRPDLLSLTTRPLHRFATVCRGEAARSARTHHSWLVRFRPTVPASSWSMRRISGSHSLINPADPDISCSVTKGCGSGGQRCGWCRQMVPASHDPR